MEWRPYSTLQWKRETLTAKFKRTPLVGGNFLKKPNTKNIYIFTFGKEYVHLYIQIIGKE
jgi:hypothetical protein